MTPAQRIHKAALLLDYRGDIAGARELLHGVLEEATRTGDERVAEEARVFLAELREVYGEG